jgi:hypothetical protein
MVQPINYLQNVQDSFKQAVQGLQIGTGISDIYAQREEADQKRIQNALAQAQQQQYQAGINTFFTTPPADRKYEDLERLFVGANKQQFDALQAVGKNMTDEKLATSKRFTGQVLAALESEPKYAMQLLKQRAETETDPMQKQAWQDTLKLAEISPEQAIKRVELIGGASFGKDWYESISNVRKSRREEAKAPSDLKEAQAKANEAFTKAEVAMATATDDVAKAKAQSEFEQARARKEKADADVAAGTVQSRIAKAAEEAKPAPGFAIIPEAERTSLGLPAGVYQRNLSTQKIEPVSKELVRIDMGQQRDTLALKELDIPRAQEFSAAAASARSLARDSRIIADLLKGKGGGATVKLTSEFAKTLGFETDTVKANDLANSLAIRGATQIRPPGSGSTSDTEFKAFVSAFPSLSNSEGGRELMAKYADAFATRSAKLADHARKLIREDTYSEEEIARFDTSLGAILKDDFYQQPTAGTGATVRVTLPNGSVKQFPNQQAADAFKRAAGIP